MMRDGNLKVGDYPVVSEWHKIMGQISNKNPGTRLTVVGTDGRGLIVIGTDGRGLIVVGTDALAQI